MKKIILSLMAGMVLFTSCDLLNPNPLDNFTEDNFFTSETNVEMYTNYFYNEWTAYGTGGSSEFGYWTTLNDNQAVTGLSGWNFIAVSASDGTWNACYQEIRRANILLKHIDEIDMPAASKNYYKGLAHLYRGWQHFCLVRKFGDCYWVDKELTTEDNDILYGPRHNRNTVMDNVLADLNFAVENMGDKNAGSRTAYNVHVANAIKSRVCLFEGTYAKYHQKDEARAEKFLKECQTASLALINNPMFVLTAGVDGYRANYNSLDLAGNTEMIMYKKYVLGVLYHANQDYCCGSTQTPGLNKAAFNAYLMKDGALPTGDDKGVLGTEGYDASKPVIYDLVAARDPRLGQQIDGYLAYVGNGRIRYEGMEGQDGAAENTTSTGYGILKFDEPVTLAKYRQATNGNETDAPVFWLAEIVLNQAEACAELGDEAGAKKYVNMLRTRAGMPELKLQGDPANNMGVSDLIWEVRRERRVELMFDINDRYWSLIRWHQLDKLDTEKYPDQTKGAWIEKGWPVDLNSVLLTEGDHGYIECNTTGVHRKFEDKHYLAPIPSGQIELNDQIGQNPGW
ncbi:MAG: RagB/SusD family nutrient uptake outer membrane protein [Paludibacteraceae bacterium]|nr:RagB/SusD family nutrient uptake outer membrane protein [Paludibacteraceae bacterium]MBP3576115.1 RagB/SusD family nutrient uptake outer membrane protein [Paludibacteraceae bacterium]